MAWATGVEAALVTQLESAGITSAETFSSRFRSESALERWFRVTVVDSCEVLPDVNDTNWEWSEALSQLVAFWKGLQQSEQVRIPCLLLCPFPCHSRHCSAGEV